MFLSLPFRNLALADGARFTRKLNLSLTFRSGVLPTKMIQQCYLQTQRLMGQQSLAEFMGLSVDIDRIELDNRKKQGIRKCGFLVNQGGKLTPEEKKNLIEINRERYGLSEIEVANIKLPAAKYLVEIYQIEKITNSKSKMSVVEKMNHLIKLQEALLNKLDNIRLNKITPGNSNQRRLGGSGLIPNKRVAALEMAVDGSEIDEDAVEVVSPQKGLNCNAMEGGSTSAATLQGITQDQNSADAKDMIAEEDEEASLLNAARKSAKRRVID